MKALKSELSRLKESIKMSLNRKAYLPRIQCFDEEKSAREIFGSPIWYLAIENNIQNVNAAPHGYYIEVSPPSMYMMNIKVLDMPLLDTSISKDNLDGRFIADLVLQILSYTAEQERENTRKRQAQGIAVMPVVNGKKVSSKTGNPIGRPNAEYPDKWTEIYSNWKSGNITATAAMEILELKRTTFYKLVKSYEAR